MTVCGNRTAEPCGFFTSCAQACGGGCPCGGDVRAELESEVQREDWQEGGE